MWVLGYVPQWMIINIKLFQLDMLRKAHSISNILRVWDQVKIKNVQIRSVESPLISWLLTLKATEKPDVIQDTS